MKKMDAFGQEQKNYYLLNKDKILASFHVDPILDEIIVDSIRVELPFWIGNLRAFIANRRAPKNRENIEQLLRESGCDTIQGYLDITHALSLVDTFWVKPQSSKLVWEEVSLYTHPFNETIAKTAFEGGLHGRHLADTSPEYGTDGSFAKCWIRENDTIKLLKRGSSGARNAGLEPYSEYYAGQLIKAFTDDFVSYDLRTRNNRICSVCDSFTSERYGFLPYAAVDKDNTDYNDVLDKMDGYGLRKQVELMFVIDAVILNEDRHKNNFGFIVDNDKQEIVKMAPMFDHNIALLPYAEEEDFAKIDDYLSMKGPRLARNWNTAAASCLDSRTKKVLINLSDFKFERHPKYNLPDWRLEALETLIHKNIQEILSIAKQLGK